METYEEREEALAWASGLSLEHLHWMVTLMASDVDALGGRYGKAVLEVVALRFGAELRGE